MKLFISYRREDSRAYSGRIYDRLKEAFGSDSVFWDIDSIPLGLPFPTVLEQTIERTDVMLVIIGPTWTSISNENGGRRIDEADDFVRLEIESALRHELPIVPVTVENAPLPIQPDLPESISRLANHQGIAIRPDPDFHDDTTRLINRLEQLLGTASRKPVTGQIDDIRVENELLRLELEWEREIRNNNYQQVKAFPFQLFAGVVGAMLVGTFWSFLVPRQVAPSLGHPISIAAFLLPFVFQSPFLGYGAVRYSRYRKAAREYHEKCEALRQHESNAVHSK